MRSPNLHDIYLKAKQSYFVLTCKIYVKDSFPGEPRRWQIADATRVVQDEYLEWSVNRGPR
ncbi:hypothetical protein BGW36DRAFT_18501 [Talaromyces proteolyticus]|uniref:Uncharacterized protein n=1 Tax=Talaromyces proteolyticus TaxID=1131652 RepID=A0AAD4L1H6_9EURO|nr:uncharacterized protein BGW36DRAFT_18501 [Talaromyces proteolyticus]KAH8705828.1 hypothetical protein BGW36DRAFT_18501 [Talaromyces proteolyticus]